MYQGLIQQFSHMTGGVPIVREYGMIILNEVVRYPLKKLNLRLVPCSRIGNGGRPRTTSSSSESSLHCHHACRANQPYWDSQRRRPPDPGQSERERE